MNVKKTIAAILRKLSGGWTFRKSLPQTFGGGRIFVTPRADIRVLKPGFQACAGDLLKVAERYVKPGMIVWDIGSNQGIFSVASAAKATSSGAVYTVEADPKYAELQNRTISQLGNAYAKITPLCAAVSNRLTILSLVIPRVGHARNHISEVAGNSAGEAESSKAVVSVTCEFLRQHWPAPGFLKIDVEGAELLLLAGMGQILCNDRPFIYIEVEQSNQDEVTRILLDADYDLFRLDEAGNEHPISRCVFNTLAKPRTQA